MRTTSVDSFRRHLMYHAHFPPFSVDTPVVMRIHWAFPTLVVVVIGDVTPTTSPETLYVVILITLGITVNAAIVGNVCNILQNVETDSSAFAKKVDEIRNYMHKHHLSHETLRFSVDVQPAFFPESSFRLYRQECLESLQTLQRRC